MSYFGSIYADQELSHRAKTVYMYLKDRSNADGGGCVPENHDVPSHLMPAAQCGGTASSPPRSCGRWASRCRRRSSGP